MTDDRLRKKFAYAFGGRRIGVYREDGEYMDVYHHTEQERITIHSLLQWLGFETDQEYYQYKDGKYVPI